MGEINKRIKLKRKTQGLTQSDIAKQLKKKESTYSQMERSGKIPCETLIEIADILKTDIRYFLYGEEFLETKAEEKEIPNKSVSEDDDRVSLDKNEEYIILTYRNLDAKNKSEAYRMFMEHFNINTIIKKRREAKRTALKAKNGL